MSADPTLTFSWLTPPAPAAIALVLVPALPALLDRALPPVGSARFARLRAPDGQVVDELVADRVDDEHLLLMPHGGPGMRQAVTDCLLAHGLSAGAARVPFADAGRWAALAAAPSPAAVQWLLAHGDESPPFQPEFLRRAPLILITGPVNAGKSTLLNAWCGRRRAIVSDLPGTTRDLLAAETVIGGWQIKLLDSAGLRTTDDPLERAGQALIAGARARADLVISLQPPGEIVTALATDLVVLGKADLRPPASATESGLRWSEHDAAAGLARLGSAVLARLGLPALPSG